MEVLPLKFINDDDKVVFGSEIVNLARLTRLGFPVADGVVVSAPQFPHNLSIKYFSSLNIQIFEENLHLLKSEIYNLRIPEDLLKELREKEKIDPQIIWKMLLDRWIEELVSLIKREGVSKEVLNKLTSQLVIFSTEVKASGKIYFDYSLKDSVINVSEGDLFPSQLKELDQLVLKMDQKLFLPFAYFFIINQKNKILITKITPLSSSVDPLISLNSNQSFEKGVIERGEKQNKKRLPLKIFLNLNQNLNIVNDLDGVIIEADNFKDSEKLILSLVEAGISFLNNPVIFKLADQKDSFGGIRGSLKLLHSEKLLKENLESFLFARHKKSLTNLSIAIPFLRSVEEFLKIKRELASLGVSRKGSLKLWVECAVPENILNMESYLKAGLDGVILNLDEIYFFLNGFNPDHPDTYHYKIDSAQILSIEQINTLTSFTKEALSLLQREKIPIIVKGEVTFREEILEFLIKAGIWGVIFDQTRVNFIPDQLMLIEKKINSLRFL